MFWYVIGLKKELMMVFAEDVEMISELLKRDLMALWGYDHL